VSEASEAGEAGPGRRAGKSASAFRTTGEVAEELDLPAHVLRFWEAKFAQLKPLKRGGGRRYYRPEEVDLLRRIRQCLYQEGYTIRGVQKLLREGALPSPARPLPPPGEPTTPDLFGLDPPAPPRPPPPEPARTQPSRQALRAALVAVRQELLEIRALLDELGST
jgi:DNA-binding transcriptional MerR regulator